MAEINFGHKAYDELRVPAGNLNHLSQITLKIKLNFSGS